MEMNKYIDHTILKSDTTSQDVARICAEAVEYNFMSVCINPGFIEFAKPLLKDSDVKVCTVIGFPLGANTTATKVFETKDAIAKGADEIDMVINVGKAIENDFDYITNEIAEIKKACGSTLLKVIFETSELTNEQIKKCCEASVKAGAEYVKTSTGFSSNGATVEHVKIMFEACNNQALVKASGGIRDLETAQAMINAGASRLGVSAGIAIMNQLNGIETTTTTSGY